METKSRGTDKTYWVVQHSQLSVSVILLTIIRSDSIAKGAFKNCGFFSLADNLHFPSAGPTYLGQSDHRQKLSSFPLLSKSPPGGQRLVLVLGVQYRSESSRVRCAALRPGAFCKPGDAAKDTAEGARPRSDFLPTPPLIGCGAYKKPVNEQPPVAATCWRSPGGIALPCQSLGGPREDEVVLRAPHRFGGACRLLHLHPSAQLRVGPLEAHDGRLHFPGRTASGE